jgi:hypothetical protein
VNREEAKSILLLYRPDATEPNDPEFAAALALTKADAELARWFEEHCARQNLLRAQFQKITPPAGLMEQIISEHKANLVWQARQRNLRRTMAFAIIIGCIFLAGLQWWPHGGDDDTFAVYQTRMVGTALRGYAMDLTGNDPAAIRNYLAQNHAPADYVLSEALKKIPTTGCSIENWQGAKVSLICFHTGKTAQSTDLWLFVANRTALKDLPELASTEFKKINLLTTATWTQGDKVYFLGLAGDEAAVKQYL